MRVFAGVGFATALLWTVGAQAMMPPYVYEEARDNATYHLTVEIIAVTASEHAVGTCQIEAKVADVMRDRSDSVAIGDNVNFSVDCLRVDTDPNEIPSCVMFLTTERLVAGARLEAYLNGGPDDYRVAEGQVSFVTAPETGSSPDA